MQSAHAKVLLDFYLAYIILLHKKMCKFLKTEVKIIISQIDNNSQNSAKSETMPWFYIMEINLFLQSISHMPIRLHLL